MTTARLLAVPAAAVLATAGLAGCGAPAAPSAVPATSTEPTRADPVTACTNQLVYWAGEQLRGVDDGGDYQHHGLSSEQNDALSRIVADAQAKGAALPPGQVTDQSRAACERIVAANPTPSGF